MRTIVNRTRRPLKIQLPGGKVLHLGPGKTGQVADPTIERESFRKRVDAGEIEVLGDGETATQQAGSPAIPGESTHGHQPTTVVHPKGNR
jgi:hypothetical protein